MTVTLSLLEVLLTSTMSLRGKRPEKDFGQGGNKYSSFVTQCFEERCSAATTVYREQEEIEIQCKRTRTVS